MNKVIITYIALGLVAISGWIWGFSNYSELNKNRIQNLATISDLENNLKLTSEANTNLQEAKIVLETELEETKNNISDLEKKNKSLDKKNDQLEKITETDPELLKKYSKIYFLNENYTPRKLDEIGIDYKLDKTKIVQVLDEIKDETEELIEDAKDDDVNILISSAYRSFGTQADLKQNYKVTYGSGSANAFSADQGYSEHQLGTTLDLTTPTLGSFLSTTFDQTAEFAWLQKNAYKYGFVLSYPKGNSYYVYEPWHWRFVGKDLARKLHRDEKNFYDLDQREIDKYIIDFFD